MKSNSGEVELLKCGEVYQLIITDEEGSEKIFLTKEQLLEVGILIKANEEF